MTYVLIVEVIWAKLIVKTFEIVYFYLLFIKKSNHSLKPHKYVVEKQLSWKHYVEGIVWHQGQHLICDNQKQVKMKASREPCSELRSEDNIIVQESFFITRGKRIQHNQSYFKKKEEENKQKKFAISGLKPFLLYFWREFS